jgi:hypothetical protein
MYMLLWDGFNYRFTPARWADKSRKEDEEPLEIVGCGQVLPVGALTMFYQVDVTLAVGAFEQATLKENQALQKARVPIVLSELTSGGGNIRGLLGAVAPLVTIAAVVLIYFQVGGALGAQQEVLKSLGVVEKIISEPLACQVAQ